MRTLTETRRIVVASFGSPEDAYLNADQQRQMTGLPHYTRWNPDTERTEVYYDA